MFKPDRWIRQQSQQKITYECMIKAGDKVTTPLAGQRFVVGDRSAILTHTGLSKEAREKILALQAGEETEFEDVFFYAVENKPLISPFVENIVRTMEVNGVVTKIPSYGLSSYGYDIRLGRHFKVFSKDAYLYSRKGRVGVAVDLLFDEPPYEEFEDADYIVLEPHTVALGVSVEKICMPRNVSAICMAKSTFARFGVILDVTPLEAGWEGYVTLEIFNKNPFPVTIYSGVGAMQLMFVEGETCDTSYADRGGKYMDQPPVPVTPKM